MAIVWFSFGQNVLAPQTPSGMPQQLGDLLFISSIEGAEALAQVRELHGIDVGLVSASIAQYGHSSPYHNAQATIWVGTAVSADAAAELTSRMRQAIERGGAPFSNLRRFTIDNHEIFRIDGPGGEHFFYHSALRREKVVWLTINADDASSILPEALKNF